MPYFCILSGKKEERICQKMTIRTTIRKNDCISQSPVSIKKIVLFWAYGIPNQVFRNVLCLSTCNKKCCYLLKSRPLTPGMLFYS